MFLNQLVVLKAALLVIALRVPIVLNLVIVAVIVAVIVNQVHQVPTRNPPQLHLVDIKVVPLAM